MVKVEAKVITDLEGNFYGIVEGSRIDFIPSSRYMWNINQRKIALSMLKNFMDKSENKQHFKEAFEQELKEKFNVDVEINVNKTKVIDVIYNYEDDTITVKYLLATKPRKKEKKERILGENNL